MDFAALRNEIDRIDAQIVDLLNQRAAFALEIGRTKRAASLAIVDETREKEILERILLNNDGPFANADMQQIFTMIITACRNLQYDV